MGETVAETLADHFRDLDPLMAATVEQIEAIEGMGPTIAESVARFLADPANRTEIQRLRDLGLSWPAADAGKTGQDGKLSGLTFVLTGTLSAPRGEIQQRIEAAGGKVTGTVSKKTSFVVAGEKAGSKLKLATELDVPVLDEEGLQKLF
ncbi:MAG: BRCT domain-containing protein [Myxococcota bacterium]